MTDAKRRAGKAFRYAQALRSCFLSNERKKEPVGADKDRIRAVEKLIDQARLTDIAKSDSDWEMRHAAVERLTDQALLAHIAKRDVTPGVRRAAVENPNLTDQSVLAEIAKTDSSDGVRREAVWKLTDDAVLADITKTDGHWQVRNAAASYAELHRNRRVRLAAGVFIREQPGKWDHEEWLGFLGQVRSFGYSRDSLPDDEIRSLLEEERARLRPFPFF